MQLKDRIAVVTGGASGIGRALCRRFAAEGYHVLVAGRTPEKIGQVAKTIDAAGGSAEAISVDTTREDDVIRLFDRAMGPGDGRAAAEIVIFNAGNNAAHRFQGAECGAIRGVLAGRLLWRVSSWPGGGAAIGSARPARSFSLELPRACEASPGLRTSPPRKQVCV